MDERRTKPRDSASWIGALYRRMSSWYIVFSILLAIVILVVGYRLTRPLLPLFLGDRPGG
jgi:hypothetical protein